MEAQREAGLASDFSTGSPSAGTARRQLGRRAQEPQLVAQLQRQCPAAAAVELRAALHAAPPARCWPTSGRAGRAARAGAERLALGALLRSTRSSALPAPGRRRSASADSRPRPRGGRCHVDARGAADGPRPAPGRRASQARSDGNVDRCRRECKPCTLPAAQRACSRATVPPASERDLVDAAHQLGRRRAGAGIFLASAHRLPQVRRPRRAG